MITRTNWKKRKFILPLAAAALTFCAPGAKAALSVSNGDFELNAAQTTYVSNWYSTVASPEADWWTATWAGPNVSPNGTSVLGLSHINTSLNWAYQGIGINDAAQDSIVINYDVGSFTDAGSARDMAMEFSIWESDGSFVPSNSVDLATADGVTEIDSITVLSGSLNPGETSTGRAVQLDLSGASTTGELFLRVSNAFGGVGEPWVALDNISLTESLPPFDVSATPTGSGIANPVVLQAVITDLGSEFDSAELYFNGLMVVPDSIDTDSGVTTVEYTVPDTLEPLSTHTGKVVAAGINPAGSTTNEWTFTMANALSFVSGSPAGAGAPTLPTIEAVITNVLSELDTSSVELFLDGAAVSIDYIDADTPATGETTIGGDWTTPLDPGTTHTGMVVYAGINPVAGPFTNSWTFVVSGDPGFGIYITDTTEPTPDEYDVYQFAFSTLDTDNINGGDDAASYVAHDRPAQGQTFTTGDEPSYELRSVWVKHAQGYETYSEFDLGDMQTIRITDPAQAGTDNFVMHSETLTVVTNTAGTMQGMPITGTGYWIEYQLLNPVTLNRATQYGFDLSTGSADYGAFYELNGVSTTNAYEGGAPYTSGTTLGFGGNDMTTIWTGARAFLVDLTAAGASVVPTIQSIVVSGGTATLTWDSESGVSYTILNNTGLVLDSWDELKTGIPGAGASTTDSVPVSDTDQEFYKVEGN